MTNPAPQTGEQWMRAQEKASRLAARRGNPFPRIAALEARALQLGPELPAFSVRHSTSFARSGAQGFSLMAFDTVLLNQGGHWSTSNTRFIAPVDGTYEFDISITQATNVGGPEAFFYKNGVATAGLPAAIAYVNYVTSTAVARMQLVADDYIQVYFRNNNGTTVTLDGTRCFFGGHLVSLAA